MKTSNSISIFNQSGFSLLEILIAITLLAFITLGVVNISDNAVQTMERTSEINQNNLQIETALSRLEWDFSQIYSPLYFSVPLNLTKLQNVNSNNNLSGSNDPNSIIQRYIQDLKIRFEQNQNFSGISQEGIPIPKFLSSSKDTFEFFTSSNRRKLENSKQSHFAWVRYTLIDQENNQTNDERKASLPSGLKSFARFFYADNPYHNQRMDPEDDSIKGAILLKNVESLEFQFWDYKRKKWETSLRSIEQGESLIRGLKVLITWYDNSGNQRKVEKTFRHLWPMVTPVDPESTTTSETRTNSNNTNTNNNSINGTEEANEDF
jgi:prepilin-type N-terminal cleavage/methylation domain-containing protein